MTVRRDRTVSGGRAESDGKEEKLAAVSATSWAPPAHSLGLGEVGRCSAVPRPGREEGASTCRLRSAWSRCRDPCGHAHGVASHSGSRGGFKEARGRKREIVSGAAGLCWGGGGRPSGRGMKGGGRAQGTAGTLQSPTALNVN